MLDPSSELSVQNKRMVFAWAGAVAMLLLLWRTSAVAVLYLLPPAPFLGVLIGTTVAIFWMLGRFKVSTIQAYFTSVALGAIFTCISFRLTTLL